MSVVDKVCIPQRRKFASLEAGERGLSRFQRLLARCHYVLCPACRAYRRAVDATRDTLAALRDE